MSKNYKTMRRREVLKAGSIGSLTPLAIGSAKGSDLEDALNYFVECSVHNDIVNRDKIGKLVTPVHCKPRIYHIEPQSNTLVVQSSEMAQNDIELIRNSTGITYYRGFHSGISNQISPPETKYPNISKLVSGDSGRSIQSKKYYSTPSIKSEINAANGSVNVRSNGEEKEVDSGSQNVVELPKRQVLAKAEEVVGDIPEIEVKETIDPDEVDLSVEKDNWWEDVSLVPRVSIRNYGGLEVRIK